jgi:hypothetical protein
MNIDHSQTKFLVELLSSPYIIFFIIWEGVWKSIAMWKSARHNQLFWFVAAAIFNTVGILPIIYILFFQKNRKGKNKS